MTLPTPAEPGRIVSGTLAVLVHLMFFGLLVFGISWQKKVASPIVVDLWQDLPEPLKKVTLPPEPPRPAPKPPKPLPEVRKEPVPPPPPAPKVETPKPSAADIELKEKLRKQKEEEAERKEEQKKAELEKRKLEEEQRKAAEDQRREEAEQKKAELEKRKLDDEARRAEEQKRVEEQRRVDEAKREVERKQQEAAQKQREAEETKRRAEAAARVAHQKLINDYMARIQAKIKGNVVVPQSMEGNPEARFDVVLLPGGDLLSPPTLRKSSGNPTYDAAVERAILRAQPLPVPTDELFQENFRELTLVFRPKD